MPNRTLARPRSHALHLSAPDQRRFLWAVAREVLCVQSHQYGLERNLIQGLPDLAEGIEACRGADEDEEADPGKGEPQPPPQPRHKPRNEENAAVLRRIGTADARLGATFDDHLRDIGQRAGALARRENDRCQFKRNPSRVLL